MASTSKRPSLAAYLGPERRPCRFCTLPEDVRIEVDTYLLAKLAERSQGRNVPIKRRPLIQWVTEEVGVKVNDHDLREHLVCLESP